MKITHLLLLSCAALVQPVLSVGQQTSVPVRGNQKIAVDDALKAKINRWMLNTGGLQFLENRGQMTGTDSKPVKDLLFKSAGNGVDMYVTTSGISYVFTHKKSSPKSAGSKAEDKVSEELYRADMVLEGAVIKKENIVKDIESKEYTNYYIGSVPGVEKVRGYERVTVKNIYPGIDWVLYTAEGADQVTTGKSGLQYDFVVHPGADPSMIKLRYKWTDAPEIKSDGSMKVSLPVGGIMEGSPVSHLMGSAENIHTQYTLANKQVGFALGNYDKSKTLVIDPALTWATFFGGTAATSQQTKGAAIWSDGTDVFVGGTTTATTFPTTIPTGYYSKTTLTSPQQLMFIAEFNATSGVRIWTTYLGGTATTESDFLEGITGELAAGGNLWVAGNTNSVTFPTTNPNNYSFYESSTNLDWNPSAGTSFVGNGYMGNSSILFTNSFGPNPGLGGNAMASVVPVVLQFTKSSGVLNYSTFFGGGTVAASGDNSRAIWDDGTNVWMTGYTSSSAFPNMYQAGYYHATGGAANTAPFIVQFSAVAQGFIPAGSLLWSTWLGTTPGVGYDICSDPSGANVYMTGVTQGGATIGLPTANPGGEPFSRVRPGEPMPPDLSASLMWRI